MATVLFSGRFDPPHCGHVATILKLRSLFGKVLVPVLQYKDEAYPVMERVNILTACLSATTDITVFKNDIHFGKINIQELESYTFDVYASGNIQCCENIRSLGVPVLYIPRSFHYAASDDPKRRNGA